MIFLRYSLGYREELLSRVSNDVLGFSSNSAKVLNSSNDLILYHATAIRFWLLTPTLENFHENGDIDLKVGFECDPDDNYMSSYLDYKFTSSRKDGKSRILMVSKEARKGSHDYTCDMRIFKWAKNRACMGVTPKY
ncbi:hypothetical protein CR513_26609, partial [Mucuna pruriens]